MAIDNVSTAQSTAIQLGLIGVSWAVSWMRYDKWWINRYQELWNHYDSRHFRRFLNTQNSGVTYRLSEDTSDCTMCCFDLCFGSKGPTPDIRDMNDKNKGGDRYANSFYDTSDGPMFLLLLFNALSEILCLLFFFVLFPFLNGIYNSVYPLANDDKLRNSSLIFAAISLILFSDITRKKSADWAFNNPLIHRIIGLVTKLVSFCSIIAVAGIVGNLAFYKMTDNSSNGQNWLITSFAFSLLFILLEFVSSIVHVVVIFKHRFFFEAVANFRWEDWMMNLKKFPCSPQTTATPPMAGVPKPLYNRKY